MDKPYRKSLRLGGWDYSSNATYHVTLCSANKRSIFGRVCGDIGSATVTLSGLGEACRYAIDEASDNVAGFSVDNYVIMPNHVHMLLSLDDGCNLGRAIARIKSKSLKAARETDPAIVLWQRGYHEHVIRDETDYQAVWEYIDSNPARWFDDELFVR